MSSRFEICLPRILKHEGGKVDHPRDPGGRTAYGVIQRTYDDYNRRQGRPRKDVFKISQAEVAAIYEANYWKSTGGKLPVGMDYPCFDGGVNSGVSRGVKWIQKGLGVAQDGRIGPVTQKAAKSADRIAVIKRACSTRMSFLRGLRHWGTFGRGWQRRVTSVEAVAIDDVLKDQKKAKGTRERIAKEEVDKATKREKADNQKAGGAAAGGAGGAVATTQLDPVMIAIVAVGIVAIAIVGIYYYRKARIENARAEAYKQLLLDIQNEPDA